MTVAAAPRELPHVSISLAQDPEALHAATLALCNEALGWGLKQEDVEVRAWRTAAAAGRPAEWRTAACCCAALQAAAGSASAHCALKHMVWKGPVHRSRSCMQ